MSQAKAGSCDTGTRVLVVEDDYFIALSIADALDRNGFRVVGPLGGRREAMEAIRSEPPDLAVVDINLQGNLTFEVADALSEASVPFLFATGCEPDVIPERYRSVPVYQKPFIPDDLVLWAQRGRNGNVHPLREPAHDTSNLLLSALPPAEWSQLKRHAQRVRIPATDGRIDAGLGEVVLFPESGFCSLTVGEASAPIEVAMVGREGLVGFAGRSVGGPPSLRPVWQTDVEAIMIGRLELQRLVGQSERLSDLLLDYKRVLSLQTAWTCQANTSLNVLSRLARWILMAADRVGHHVVITHTALARALHVRRASVTTSLHVLEGDRAILSRRGMITVRNRALLLQVAGPCYGAPEAEYERLLGHRGVALAS